MTNTEFVLDIMEHSRFGPMAQLFVLEAIRRYASACANAAPESMSNAFLSGETWQAVAYDIHLQIEARYNRE